MRIEELNRLIEQGEGLKLEFKENFDAKSIAKEITAFANSEGGRIFLGISDKGEVKFVRHPMNVREKVTEKVTENQKQIIDLIEQNRFITVVELAGKIKISRKSVLENISKLKQKGILKRIGPDKGGYWEITER